MKKLNWLLTKVFGKKYFITETEELQKDEVLFYRHRIYVPKKKKGNGYGRHKYKSNSTGR